MKRLRVGEVMDQPGLDRSAHEHALRSLNRANRLFGVDRRLWRSVRKAGGSGCSILDIGCGGGGFLRFVSRARGDGAANALVGVDRSSAALRFAREGQQQDIRWIAADAMRLPLADASVEVVTLSLFLHHFGEAEAVTILKEAGRVSRRAIVVGELVRSWPAWTLTYVVTRVLSRSWIFHGDGPRSVRAAFRAAELRDLARQAGLEPVKVRRVFPFRYILTWQKMVN